MVEGKEKGGKNVYTYKFHHPHITSPYEKKRKRGEKKKERRSFFEDSNPSNQVPLCMAEKKKEKKGKKRVQPSDYHCQVKQPSRQHSSIKKKAMASEHKDK